MQRSQAAAPVRADEQVLVQTGDSRVEVTRKGALAAEPFDEEGCRALAYRR
jgi:hypothetical protein